MCMFCRSLIVLFSSPCQRQSELLPSLGVGCPWSVVRRPSSANFPHQVSDTGSGEPLVWYPQSPSAVDYGFQPRSGHTKEYNIVICCFSAKHAALRSKTKD